MNFVTSRSLILPIVGKEYSTYPLVLNLPNISKTVAYPPTTPIQICYHSIHISHPTHLTHLPSVLLLPNSINIVLGLGNTSTPLKITPIPHFHLVFNWFRIINSPLKVILHVKIFRTQ